MHPYVNTFEILSKHDADYFMPVMRKLEDYTIPIWDILHIRLKPTNRAMVTIVK